MVKLKWLEVKRTKLVKIMVEGVNLLEKVKQSKVKNNKVVKAVEEIKQARVKMKSGEKLMV